MPNYALDALRGYQAVDNIYRQERQDTFDLEDRETNKKRLAVEDGRLQLERQRTDKEYNDRQTLRDADVAEINSIFGADVAQNPQAVAKISSMAKDPQRTGEMIALHDTLSKYMAEGKTPPQELLVKMMNLTGPEELQARGGDDGLHRQVESIVPSTVPGEVMIGLSVTGKDGKTYQAPMTTGASADPADNIVQSIPVSKLVEWTGGAASTAKALAIARARAGDRSFLESYHAAIAAQQAEARAVAKARRERTEGMEDYEAKKQIDQKYQKPQGPVAAGKYGMFYKGKFIENPMTKGLEEGGWETVTDPQTGEETMRRTGKRGSADKQTVKANDDGSFSVYDPLNGGAKLVYPPTVADRIADEMTAAWKEEQEGLFGGASDAEVKAKRKEFRDSLPTGMPDGQPGNGGQSTGQGQYAPGQVLVQNGKEYVVDAQGMPQEKGTGGEQAGTAGNGSAGKKTGEAETAQKKPAAKPQPKQDPAEARMLELEGQRKAEQGNGIVSTAGLTTLKNAGAAVVEGTKKDAELALDLYGAFVGQPFLDALTQIKTSQQKQAALFNLDQRFKNKAISPADYKKALAIINSK